MLRRVLLVGVAMCLILLQGTSPVQRVEAGSAPPAGSAPLGVPFVRVIDGDTFEATVQSKQWGIGVLGVDAPQGNTACGREASAELRRLVRGGVRLEDDASLTFDARGRRMYDVMARDGRSIAVELARAGVARSDGLGARRQEVTIAESEARAARRGCLSGGSQATSQSGSAAETQALALPAAAAALPTGFSQDVVAEGLNSATNIAFMPDGRMLIAEKAGLVKVVKDGVLLPTPLIDIRGRVNDYWDHGLLGLAVHPRFPTDPFVYLLFTFENNAAAYDGTKTARLARYTVSGDTASISSEVIVLGSVVGSSCNDFPVGADCLPSDSPSHSIGSVKFAPDGNLFVTTGDGAHFNFVDDNALRAQNLDSLAGKVLRITPNGAGVQGNPFWRGGPSTNRSKVWASGLRNPYRMHLRPGSGVPILGDVGWFTWEEVDAAVSGANLGWPCYEGAARQAGYEPKAVCQALYAQGATAVRPPLTAWNHNGVSSAATGGVFYTGSAYPVQYQGAYFFADYAQSWMRTLRLDADHLPIPGSEATFATAADYPVAIEMGPDGWLHYVSISTGQVRRIRYTTGNTPPSAQASASPAQGLAPLEVQFSSAGSTDPDGDPLQFTWSFGDATPNSAEANPRHTYQTDGTYSAALTVDDSRGGSAQAQVIVTVGNRAPTAAISSPSSTLRYKVGDTISLAGAATDPEDGTLAASALSWQVILHHCPGGMCHTHPFLSASGASGSFVVPDHGDESHFEIVLSAADTRGLIDTDAVVLQPQTVRLILASVPSRARLVYDGSEGDAPLQRTTVVGSRHTIGAPSPQGDLVFGGWSDGGTQQHDITVGTTDTTLTATFNDTVAPGLTAISVGGVNPTRATVTWSTNEPADSQAEYGLTGALGSLTALDSALVTTHSVQLTGLKPKTTYFYRVRSRDASGTVSVSETRSFTTR